MSFWPWRDETLQPEEVPPGCRYPPTLQFAVKGHRLRVKLWGRRRRWPKRAARPWHHAARAGCPGPRWPAAGPDRAGSSKGLTNRPLRISHSAWSPSPCARASAAPLRAAVTTIDSSSAWVPSNTAQSLALRPSSRRPLTSDSAAMAPGARRLRSGGQSDRRRCRPAVRDKVSRRCE